MGCYLDWGGVSPRVRDLNASTYFSSPTMTFQLCASFCVYYGYYYFGVQYAYIYIYFFFKNISYPCDNFYGSQGYATNCNMTCTGNSSQICGGKIANSVYSISIYKIDLNYKFTF